MRRRERWSRREVCVCVCVCGRLRVGGAEGKGCVGAPLRVAVVRADEGVHGGEARRTRCCAAHLRQDTATKVKPSPTRGGKARTPSRARHWPDGRVIRCHVSGCLVAQKVTRRRRSTVCFRSASATLPSHQPTADLIEHRAAVAPIHTPAVTTSPHTRRGWTRRTCTSSGRGLRHAPLCVDTSHRSLLKRRARSTPPFSLLPHAAPAGALPAAVLASSACCLPRSMAAARSPMPAPEAADTAAWCRSS